MELSVQFLNCGETWKGFGDFRDKLNKNKNIDIEFLNGRLVRLRIFDQDVYRIFWCLEVDMLVLITCDYIGKYIKAYVPKEGIEYSDAICDNIYGIIDSSLFNEVYYFEDGRAVSNTEIAKARMLGLLGDPRPLDISELF